MLIHAEMNMNIVRNDSDPYIQVSSKDVSACHGTLELYDGALQPLWADLSVWLYFTKSPKSQSSSLAHKAYERDTIAPERHKGYLLGRDK